jgi:hypothetical protein
MGETLNSFSLKKQLVTKCYTSEDWIRLAQDSDQWRAVVSIVMNLRVP